MVGSPKPGNSTNGYFTVCLQATQEKIGGKVEVVIHPNQSS
jgi:hypothetical protein